MSIRIFVEGNDDKKFIVTLLNDLKKNKEIEVADNIDFNARIEVMGCKSTLLDSSHKKYQKVASKIGFEIKEVLFIFDCDFEKDDNNCNGMYKSNKCFDNLIKNLNWNITIENSSHLHIFDRNLDYFLVETIKNKDCYKDFKSLIDCLDIENLKPNKKPIANLYRDLYPYPQFDFKDDRFDELKQKLKNLFKEQK
jgi:hypothetical protein